MTVMLLGGLWHGASWNFVIWGALARRHAGGGTRAGAATASIGGCRGPCGLRLTFAIVCVAWVFFRAATLGHAWTYLKSMAGWTASAAGSELILASLVTPYHVLMFALCAIVVWTAPQTWNFTQRLTAPKAAVCLALLLRQRGADVDAGRESVPVLPVLNNAHCRCPTSRRKSR